jgi:hypothetical protein
MFGARPHRAGHRATQSEAFVHSRHVPEGSLRGPERESADGVTPKSGQLSLAAKQVTDSCNLSPVIVADNPTPTPQCHHNPVAIPGVRPRPTAGGGLQEPLGYGPLRPVAVNLGAPDGPENHGVPGSNILQPYCNRVDMHTFAMDILLRGYFYRSRIITGITDGMERIGTDCERPLATSSEIGNRVGGVKPSRGFESLPLRFPSPSAVEAFWCGGRT